MFQGKDDTALVQGWDDALRYYFLTYVTEINLISQANLAALTFTENTQSW